MFCVSTDDGRTWSAPRTIPMADVPLAVSHSIRPVTSGRLLAPTGLCVSKQHHSLLRAGWGVLPAIGLLPMPIRSVLLAPLFSSRWHSDLPQSVSPVAAVN